MEELAYLGLFVGILILIFFVFLMGVLVLQIVGQWKMFKKAGKKGWEAIIPYYNTWVLIEISECKWWFFLIYIGSIMLTNTININDYAVFNYFIYILFGVIVNYVVMYFINYNIAKKFNKDVGFAIGLTLLPYVFYPILGLGKSEYNKNVKVSPYGVIKKGDV